MATKTIEVCDIFGVAAKDLEHYRVTVEKFVGPKKTPPTNGDDAGGDWEQWDGTKPKLMCGRAYARLKQFISRGMAPPGGGPVIEEDEEESGATPKK